ncbi:hypothetical protein tb265_50270 [Gemmatimonadetes bacterium T265]|nr:hypothetical protein tb265_50270 [Gemmatimonadetes bacterium T265]
MIGSAGLGGGFAGLAGYLVYGRGRDDASHGTEDVAAVGRGAARVAWVETRNLETTDPAAAAEIMAATAKAFPNRLEKPVYHV